MFSLYNLIVVALVALAAGCILGALLSRMLSPKEQKARSLESQLQEAEEQLGEYQQQVTEHFAETAKLVNNLTQSYRDVHEHLANDALKLANVDISRQLLSHDKDDKVLGDTSIDTQDFQPPRDWAPKTPGSEGTLSENFGLREDDDYAELDKSKAR